MKIQLGRSITDSAIPFSGELCYWQKMSAVICKWQKKMRAVICFCVTHSENDFCTAFVDETNCVIYSSIHSSIHFL